jgi:TonB family protein
MNNTDANQATHGYELKDELARLCLPAATRDPNLKLAWVNSVCILFLLIGILGARRGLISIRPAPPLEEIIPVIVEPMTLPPQEAIEKKETDDDKNDTPQVAVAIPQSPNVSFSVPTIASLVVPANLASAPPLEPMRTAAQIGSLNNTGGSGDRPAPTEYPSMAREEGQQGTVVLLLGGDAAGNITSIDVKESSGFPILDHAAVEFIKNHWRLPTNAGTRLFQTSITYQLQLN